MDKSSEGIVIMKDETIEYINDKFIDQQMVNIFNLDLTMKQSYYHISHSRHKCIRKMRSAMCPEKERKEVNKLNQ